MNAPPRDWVLGDCWLCDTTDLAVQWVGPARVDIPDNSINTHLYACAVCLERVRDRALAEQRARYAAAPSFAPP